MNPVAHAYRAVNSTLSMPFMWIRLGANYEGWALVDSGAWVNVLPYSIGLAMGLNWDDFPNGAKISGAVTSSSKEVKVNAKIRGFEEIELKFAWIRHDEARLILGHDNFFRQFDIYFSTVNEKFILTQAAPARAARED